MKILGIETSCDETAAAVVEDGTKILSNVVVSQIDIFAEYGGVIPEIAARSHLEAIIPVVDKALADAKCSWEDIDAIAVTHAPGLLGSLLIGTLTARTLSILHNKPLYAVHHLKSHVYANWLDYNPQALLEFYSPVKASKTQTSYADTLMKSPQGSRSTNDSILQNCSVPDVTRETDLATVYFPIFPLLALVISGGHTQILYMNAHNHFEVIGSTRDDAVGECFDKIAKILGLPYPGGPSIAKVASTGDKTRYKLPHPKVPDLDFSFSGLKTAVLRAVQKELKLPISHPSYDLKNHLTETQVADFAASFQKTAIEILLDKLDSALQTYPEIKSVVFAGGVSANSELRLCAKKRFSSNKDLQIYFPKVEFSGDNGAMVAAAAYFEISTGVTPTDPYSLNIYPRISIDQ